MSDADGSDWPPENWRRVAPVDHARPVFQLDHPQDVGYGATETATGGAYTTGVGRTTTLQSGDTLSFPAAAVTIDVVEPSRQPKRRSQQ